MFSERELSVIEVLGKKTLSIKEISYSLFGADLDTPLNAEIIVSNNIQRITKKCKHYKLPWTLKKNRVLGKLYIYRAAVKS